MLFINTRPADRAQALSQCLEQAKIGVIDLPVLELRAKAFDAHLLQLYPALLSTQVVVVVSPTAVIVGMDYLQQAGMCLSQLKHVQWVAVGKTTATALAQFGIESIVPEVESSEGMLSLPLFNSFKQLTSVAFWRGEGGRQFMMQQCAEKNIEVLNFILYQRACPQDTIDSFDQIATEILSAPAPYWVCMSSEASWKNWLELCKANAKLLNECHYLVLGERLDRLLNVDKKNLKAKFDVSQLSDLNPQTVLKHIDFLQRKL